MVLAIVRTRDFNEVNLIFQLVPIYIVITMELAEGSFPYETLR